MVAGYSVCITLVEGEESANSRWNVNRKLTEFQMLHRKLTEVTPRVGEQIIYVLYQSLNECRSVYASCSVMCVCVCICQRFCFVLFFSPQCFPSLKKLQLPSLSKLPFKSIDQKFLDKSKMQLNAFLQVCLPETCAAVITAKCHVNRVGGKQIYIFSSVKCSDYYCVFIF